MQQKLQQAQNPAFRQGGFNRSQQPRDMNQRRSNTPYQNRAPHMQHGGNNMSVHHAGGRNTSLDPQ